MVVINLTNCPMKLRGDLSKWLCEINTGVYVGNISARVRDKLWERVCENIKSGQATMVYTTSGEQGMDFRVHNTSWIPVEYDGIKLMKRPLPGRNVVETEARKQNLTKAEVIHRANQIQISRQKKSNNDKYVVVDIETTGLSVMECDIIEIAAIRIANGEIEKCFKSYVKTEAEIPENIFRLTGISGEILKSEGRPLKEVILEFKDFIGADNIVSHNIMFDMAFIKSACLKTGLKPPSNLNIDTLAISRRKIKNVSDYKLATLVNHLGIEESKAHNAYNDCYMTYRLYEKLKEK